MVMLILFEFDKNANSIIAGFGIFPFCIISLATIGVCVFYATTSVVAFFVF